MMVMASYSQFVSIINHLWKPFQGCGTSSLVYVLYCIKTHTWYFHHGTSSKYWSNSIFPIRRSIQKGRAQQQSLDITESPIIICIHWKRSSPEKSKHISCLCGFTLPKDPLPTAYTHLPQDCCTLNLATGLTWLHAVQALQPLLAGHGQLELLVPCRKSAWNGIREAFSEEKTDLTSSIRVFILITPPSISELDI